MTILCCSAGVAFVVRDPNDPGTSLEELSRGSKTGYTAWPTYTIDTQEFLVFGEFLQIIRLLQSALGLFSKTILGPVGGHLKWRASKRPAAVLKMYELEGPEAPLILTQSEE